MNVLYFKASSLAAAIQKFSLLVVYSAGHDNFCPNYTENA